MPRLGSGASGGFPAGAASAPTSSWGAEADTGGIAPGSRRAGEAMGAGKAVAPDARVATASAPRTTINIFAESLFLFTINLYMRTRPRTHTLERRKLKAD